MEIVKNIATIVGCIISCVSLLTIICKPLRKKFANFVKRAGNQDAVEAQLSEIKAMLTEQTRTANEFQERVENALAITTDFTEAQCRNTIKNIFYRHKCDKVLPLYEKKTLMDIEELYINRMHKNHWGKTLLDEMNTWEVDSSGTDMQDFDE